MTVRSMKFFDTSLAENLKSIYSLKEAISRRISNIKGSASGSYFGFLPPTDKNGLQLFIEEYGGLCSLDFSLRGEDDNYVTYFQLLSTDDFTIATTTNHNLAIWAGVLFKKGEDYYQYKDKFWQLRLLAVDSDVDDIRYYPTKSFPSNLIDREPSYTVRRKIYLKSIKDGLELDENIRDVIERTGAGAELSQLDDNQLKYIIEADPDVELRLEALDVMNSADEVFLLRLSTIQQPYLIRLAQKAVKMMQKQATLKLSLFLARYPDILSIIIERITKEDVLKDFIISCYRHFPKTHLGHHIYDYEMYDIISQSINQISEVSFLIEILGHEKTPGFLAREILEKLDGGTIKSRDILPNISSIGHEPDETTLSKIQKPLAEIYPRVRESIRDRIAERMRDDSLISKLLQWETDPSLRKKLISNIKDPKELDRLTGQERENQRIHLEITQGKIEDKIDNILSYDQSTQFLLVQKVEDQNLLFQMIMEPDLPIGIRQEALSKIGSDDLIVRFLKDFEFGPEESYLVEAAVELLTDITKISNIIADLPVSAARAYQFRHEFKEVDEIVQFVESTGVGLTIIPDLDDEELQVLYNRIDNIEMKVLVIFKVRSESVIRQLLEIEEDKDLIDPLHFALSKLQNNKID